MQIVAPSDDCSQWDHGECLLAQVTVPLRSVKPPTLFPSLISRGADIAATREIGERINGGSHGNRRTALRVPQEAMA